VIVVAVNERLYLSQTRPETIAMDLAARLPEAKAAHTHSLNCAVADLHALLGGEMLNGASPSIRDAKKVVHWLKMPYVHPGQLYAAIRDGHSNRSEPPSPRAGWTPNKAASSSAPTPAAGSAWPGHDPQDVAGKLTQLETQLRGR
jgi:hypothetical protein